MHFQKLQYGFKVSGNIQFDSFSLAYNYGLNYLHKMSSLAGRVANPYNRRSPLQQRNYPSVDCNYMIIPDRSLAIQTLRIALSQWLRHPAFEFPEIKC